MTKSFAVLGCGKMGSALMPSIVSSCDFAFFMYDPDIEKSKVLSDSFRKRARAESRLNDLSGLNYYLICCKPDQFSELAQMLKTLINENSIVISIMAGISVRRIESEVGTRRVVRIMPNTPAAVGKGVLLKYTSDTLSAEEQNEITQMFQDQKVFIMESEETLDKVTGVSGSGPAYVFELARILEKNLLKFGLSENDSRQIAKSTIVGAAKLLDSSDSPEELRNNVTSKKGVTYEALKVLSDSGLEEIFSRALDAAFKRSEEISKE